MAEELRPYQVTALSVTPGFLRSEQMLDHFGVTEDNWQDAARKSRISLSRRPLFPGAGHCGACDRSECCRQERQGTNQLGFVG